MVCVSAFFTACAQKSTGIQKTYAYFRVSTPGNIPVDEHGNALERDDTVRVIYMECSGAAMPVIDYVQYPGKLYTASVFKEEQVPVTVGRFTIRPAKANTLWRVELTPSDEKKPPRTSKIIMKGKRNGRTFSQVIVRETQLASPLHM